MSDQQTRGGQVSNTFSCYYCHTTLVASAAPTVTCDVCHKLNAVGVDAPAFEPPRSEVTAALTQGGWSAEVPHNNAELRPEKKPSRPQRIKLQRNQSGVELRFRDWRAGDPMVVAVGAIAFGLLAWAAVKWVSNPGAPRGPEDDGPLGPLIFAALMGFFLVGSLNRFLAPVVLSATPRGLKLRAGLFGRKQRSIERAQLRQLYCVSRELPPSEDGDRPETRYHLVALLRDDTTVDLAELSDPEAALYLEGELERTLDIKDQPVGPEAV